MGRRIIINRVSPEQADAVAKARAEAAAKTQETYGWLGRKWREIKAVFGLA